MVKRRTKASRVWKQCFLPPNKITCDPAEQQNVVKNQMFAFYLLCGTSYISSASLRFLLVLPSFLFLQIFPYHRFGVAFQMFIFFCHFFLYCYIRVTVSGFLFVPPRRDCSSMRMQWSQEYCINHYRLFHNVYLVSITKMEWIWMRPLKWPWNLVLVIPNTLTSVSLESVVRSTWYLNVSRFIQFAVKYIDFG